MIIAGLQKLSLVDYPGSLSAVVFLQGCNFRCSYCQNPDLIPSKSGFLCEEDEVLDYLKKRSAFLEGLVISGGEPIVHRDLGEFIKKVKELGYKIKLDTNGSDPDSMKGLLNEGLLDYIAVDIKTSLGKYSKVTTIPDIGAKITETVRILLELNKNCEFRTTCMPGIIQEEDIVEIAELVRGAENYYLQQFRPDITYDENCNQVKPYKRKDLERFLHVLSKTVKHVFIRGA